MLESFDKLNLITGPVVVDMLKEMATMYRRHARIIITVLHVFKSPNQRVVVQVEQEGDDLTEFELAKRAYYMFQDAITQPIVPYVVVKEKGDKFTLSQLNEVIVGYGKDDYFIVGLSFDRFNGTVSFEYNGREYWLEPLYGIPDPKRLEQAAKWVKHEMIERATTDENEAESRELTVDDLKYFFAERPSVSLSAFSQEAGFSDKLIRHIVRGDRNLTEKVASALLKVMKKYGYEAKPFDPYAGGKGGFDKGY